MPPSSGFNILPPSSSTSCFVRSSPVKHSRSASVSGQAQQVRLLEQIRLNNFW
ncbi:hypothetical protein SESBI_13312 [Sesbania bispinosa]|nr:hypothetical protein SESBI_13312 [Sesbania bispinosa]